MFRKKSRRKEGTHSQSIERFSKRQRMEHWIIVFLFFLLVLTGIPQKFFDSWWAEWIVRGMGGLDIMRWLHRMAGLLFSAFTLYFLGYTVIDILRGRISATMVPFPADLREVHQSILWAAGLGAQPRAPRFDFREKFEFWGMLFGSLLMVATGLMLYFPLLTTRWLPGVFIPVAKTAHSYEAQLAFLIIVFWHLYNTIFRPSVFPLDRAMIDGRMSLDRLREEHPLEYERFFSDGKEGKDNPKEVPDKKS